MWPSEPDRAGALPEGHWVGPTRASLIVCLSQRHRGSRVLTQEFLMDGFGVSLSTSTLNQCLHEAGRAHAPVAEEPLAAEVTQAERVHADETTGKEAGQALWLGVFCSAPVTLSLVGYRPKEIIENLLGSEFAGGLMTEGYPVYRDYLRRLRCWAHWVRQARGLTESLDPQEAPPFGRAARALLEELMQAVYPAREGPPLNLWPH